MTSSETLNCVCLICSKDIKDIEDKGTRKQNAEAYTRIFKVLCSHMKWEVAPEKSLRFPSEVFPFCNDCKVILSQLDQLQGQLEEIFEGINGTVCKVTGSIVESETRRMSRAGSAKKEFYDSDDSISELALTSSKVSLCEYSPEKIQWYRKCTTDRYCPVVQLSPDNYEEYEIKYRAQSLPPSSPSEFLPTDICEVSHHKSETADPSDFDVDWEDSRQSPNNNDDEEGSGSELEDDPADGGDSNYGDSDSPSDKANDSNPLAAGEDDEMNEEEQGAKERPNMGIPYDPGSDYSHFNFPKRVQTLLASYGPRTSVVSATQLVADNKFPFELVHDQWKCTSCTDKAYYKIGRLFEHFKQTCHGVAPENSTKTFKLYDYAYDLLTNGRYSCRRCDNVFVRNKDQMRAHIKSTHIRKGGRYGPREILYKQVGKNKYMYGEQFPFEHVDLKYVCGTCSMEFKNIKTIAAHIRNRHAKLPAQGSKEYVSRIHKLGERKYASEYNELKIPFEFVDDKYVCGECSYRASHMNGMRDHINYEHFFYPKITCEVCGFSCRWKTQLKQHLETHNANSIPWICDVCGKTFKTAALLRGHTYHFHVPEEDKKFVCEVCGAKFLQKGYLSSHMIKHQTRTCPICGKTVKRACMDTHVRAHSTEATFECDKCQNKFKHPAGLRAHSKYCGGVKGFSCELCGMKFTQSCSVKRHKRRWHNPEKPSKRKPYKTKSEPPDPEEPNNVMEMDKIIDSIVNS